MHPEEFAENRMKTTALGYSILYNKHKLGVVYRRMSNGVSYNLCMDLDLRKSTYLLSTSHYFSTYFFIILYLCVATDLFQGY